MWKEEIAWGSDNWGSERGRVRERGGGRVILDVVMKFEYGYGGGEGKSRGRDTDKKW